MKIDTYWTYICPHCPLKADCTTGNERRLDRKPDAKNVRRRTIEHVFGTLKHWIGLQSACVHQPIQAVFSHTLDLSTLSAGLTRCRKAATC